MYTRAVRYVLSLTPYGANIAKAFYYRVVHSRRRLLSKFQLSQTCSFVLTARGSERVGGLWKKEKEQYQSMIQFFSLFFLQGRSYSSEIKERLDTVYSDSSPSMATIKTWFNKV